MRQENLRERGNTIRGVKCSQVNTGFGEGLVGGSEQREWPFALEGSQKIGLDHSSHEGIVNAGALSRAWNVVGGIRRRQHLVNDMDDAVAGGNIGRRDRGAVDHDRGPDGEGQRVSVQGRSRHAVGNVGCWNFAFDDVVSKNVREGRLAVGRVEGLEVNACICKRLVGWSEHREWTVTLQRLEKFCLNNTGHQRMVIARALGGSWDVVGGVGRSQNLVDDVNHTVAGGHVSEGNIGAVDHREPVANVERKRLAVDGLGRHAVRKRT